MKPNKMEMETGEETGINLSTEIKIMGRTKIGKIFYFLNLITDPNV